MNHSSFKEIQPQRQSTPESDPLLQFLRDNKKISRGKQIASTLLLVCSGLILYLDNALDWVIDTNIAVPNFIILKNFIYAMEMSVAPVMIIFASRMKPFRIAYLVPLYAYMNMIIGNIILLYGYQIFDFWWYRLLIFATAILVYFVLNRTAKFYEAYELQQDIKDALLKNYQSQSKDEK